VSNEVKITSALYVCDMTIFGITFRCLVKWGNGMVHVKNYDRGLNLLSYVEKIAFVFRTEPTLRQIVSTVDKQTEYRGDGKHILCILYYIACTTTDIATTTRTTTTTTGCQNVFSVSFEAK